VARLIYVFLAFALGTLVAGFLVRDSSLPLYFSIGLSGLVLVMILFGTSRRLRRDAESDVDETELAELEIVELDEEPQATPTEAGPTIVAPPRKRPARPRAVRPPAAPAGDQAAPEEEPTIVPEPPAPPRRRPRTAAPRSETAGFRPDETAPEPTIQIDEPPTPTRRRPRVSGPPAEGFADVPSAASATPSALARKVWVIPGRSRYHTRSCRFAKGDELREVTETTARRRGYVPCSVCNPDQASG
jgi:hypothetical protein